MHGLLTMQGISKRFNKAQDEASTARSGLRSTEKLLANQRTASVQLKLDDELHLLVCMIHFSTVISPEVFAAH